MEYFDIVDEQGNPTGQTVERKQAHRNNILHRTAHVWIVRRRGDSIQILCRKGAWKKTPSGLLRHRCQTLPAGVDYIPSALRELREELGLTMKQTAYRLWTAQTPCRRGVSRRKIPGQPDKQGVSSVARCGRSGHHSAEGGNRLL